MRGSVPPLPFMASATNKTVVYTLRSVHLESDDLFAASNKHEYCNKMATIIVIL
jgi:hypothetical protein